MMQGGDVMDYNKLLEQLRRGEIDEFQLAPAEFPTFYEAWRNYPYQNLLRGVAARGGLVTYQRAKPM